MTIDLSELQAGDSVIFSDNCQSVVAGVKKHTAICGIRNSGTMTTFYLSFFDKKYDNPHNEFFGNGDSHWFSNKKLLK